MAYTIVQGDSGVIDDPKRTYPSALQTIHDGLATEPLYFYRYLRRIGYTHRSAVASVLMHYSPSKEDLYKRLERRREYYQLDEKPKEGVYCTCCGLGGVKVVPCPNCGELICQDCTPPFGAHVCEIE
jgi:hypothetical protein